MTKSKLGLFLGAGFSYELGMPLVWDLTKKFKEYFTPSHLKKLNDGWKDQGSGYHEQVIDEVISLLQDDTLNYENILGFLQTAAQQRNRAFSEDYRSLYLIMLEAIYFQLYFYQRQAVKDFDLQASSFKGLKNFSAQSDVLWVFSLNHDLIFEMIADLCELSIHDGFWPEKSIAIPIKKDSRYVIDADVITAKDLETGQINVLNKVSDIGINLIKLHGSLDVFTFNNGDDLCRLRSAGRSFKDRITHLIAANELIQFKDSMGEFRVKNEIVYADTMGEAQFLRRTLLAGAQKFSSKYAQTLPQRMIELFKSYINYVDDLYIVGYSFGDLHVDKIIREWLEFSSNRMTCPLAHIQSAEGWPQWSWRWVSRWEREFSLCS